jgi:hypothetical protein
MNGLPLSVLLPPLVDQYVYLCRSFVHTLSSRGGRSVGLEPTASCVHDRDLVFLRIECVLGGRSVYSTRPWVRGLRAHTILRE